MSTPALRRAANTHSVCPANGRFLLEQDGRIKSGDVHEICGETFDEVWVKAGGDTCAKRDPKGLYAKARAGQIQGFTGVGASYEPPQAPEVVLDT